MDDVNATPEENPELIQAEPIPDAPDSAVADAVEAPAAPETMPFKVKEERADLPAGAVRDVASALGWDPNDVVSSLRKSRDIDRRYKDLEREKALLAREREESRKWREENRTPTPTPEFSDPQAKTIHAEITRLTNLITQDKQEAQARETEKAEREQRVGEVIEEVETLMDRVKEANDAGADLPIFSTRAFLKELERSPLARVDGLSIEDVVGTVYQQLELKHLRKAQGNGNGNGHRPAPVTPATPRMEQRPNPRRAVLMPAGVGGHAPQVDNRPAHELTNEELQARSQARKAKLQEMGIRTAADLGDAR